MEIGHGSETSDRQMRDRAIRLFRFLRELTELRLKTIRSLEQYEEVVWFNDIPHEAGCFCISWPRANEEEHPEVWIEIKKPLLKPPPKLSQFLEPWVDRVSLADSRRTRPEARESIIMDSPNETDEDGRPRPIRVSLVERPDVVDTLERYVSEKWLPWAEEDRRLQTIQEVYADLFGIYQKQQRLGESYEVIVGIGYLTLINRGGHEIKRHLIAAQTSLTFDADRGVIRIGPAGQGPNPTVEQDMLDPSERPSVEELNAIEQQVTDIGDELWDGVKVQTALRSWVHASSSRGHFDDALTPQSDIRSEPIVHLAPALVLRRRTERNLIRVFSEISDQLSAGKPVPVGVQRLVTIMDDVPGTADRVVDGVESRQHAPTIGEIYFPLPANDEQLDIVRKLANRQGVLVQGPPGTGKSHTIVNLICHLLATGQRVLITSHAPRALKVLLDKFKTDTDLKDISALCVVLLGDDQKSLNTLEECVAGIDSRYNDWNPTTNERRIVALERKLDEARKLEASSLAEIRALHESETYRHALGFGSYDGTAQQIAQRVYDESSRYAWMTFRIAQDQETPLSDDKAVLLLQLLRELTHDQELEASQELPTPGILLPPEDFARLISNERTARSQHEESIRAQGQYSTEVLRGLHSEVRQELIEGVTRLLRAYNSVISRPHAWVREAALQILGDRDRVWRELLSFTTKHLQALYRRGRAATERTISGLEGRDRNVVRAHAERLQAHLDSGRTLGFGPFRPRVVREALYLMNEVRVNGHPCNTPDVLEELIETLDLKDRLEKLCRWWSPHTSAPEGTMTAQAVEYRDLCEPLEEALQLHEIVTTLKGTIVNIRGLTEPIWHDPDQIQAFQNAAVSAQHWYQYEEARRAFSSLENRLVDIASHHTAHSAVKDAFLAVQERNLDRYRDAYQSINKLYTIRERLRVRQSLLEQLETAAPPLANEVRQSCSDEAWDIRMREFTAAWNWARARSWLEEFSDPKTEERLSRTLDRARAEIHECIRDLTAAKAWGHCFSPHRMTEHVRQHLRAWDNAVQRVGRGTGSRAHLHRQEARAHMQECRPAIPAWVMPIYRVAETIHPGQDSFDVVIVDEASQAGPEALFLHYLAKKIVVVGDDKQISPDFVGITRDEVDQIRHRHIRDLPHSDALGVETSFFDQAEIRYGGRIRLREHFRCMPEIIQFSNNLCYRNDPLIPLRQYGVDRLSPVVHAQHVREGYQKGASPRVVNPPEAEAIAERIRACCNDPTYAKKSMGVISLLGEAQAKLIEELLRKSIKPQEMDKRQLICGDAYAFQGDERDVIFLSLVSAPTDERRIIALTSKPYERRFNVAASRARDQLWLYHTATLNDLNPVCLRYRLLDYCQNPKLESQVVGGQNIQGIELLARTADRTREQPPSPFDSWFEVDVFLRVVRRGFRVIPQFALAGRKIDLVIEGMKGRLAVECDGDVWHGSDTYLQDMQRQRMLERCGLQFWRIRGSTFYGDPDGALEELWGLLNRKGIYASSRSDPVVDETRSGSRTERHGPMEPPPTTDSPSRAYLTRSLAETSNQAAAPNINQAEGSSTSPAARSLIKSEVQTISESAPAETRHAAIQSPVDRVVDSPNRENQVAYRNWMSRPLPDPRSAHLVDEVVSGLVDIIGAEGPIICYRAYSIYARAAGVQRVGGKIQSIFNNAIRKAERLGSVVTANEHHKRDTSYLIVRSREALSVSLRTRGDRHFDEIPPSEIRALVSLLLSQQPKLSADELVDRTAEGFQIGRITVNIRSRILEIRHQFSTPT